VNNYTFDTHDRRPGGHASARMPWVWGTRKQAALWYATRAREHAAQNECAGRSAGVRSEHSWCIGYGVSLTR
jgi:hypothetical protein